MGPLSPTAKTCTPVERFLEDTGGWREALAEEANIEGETAQQVLGRVLFLRLGEDRGLAPYGQLLELAGSRDVSRKLGTYFRAATPSLPDEPMRRLVRRLYPPECPYTFQDFPPDILGQVYERFLGKVRRAGGVYYTPAEIVDFLVRGSVGTLLERVTLETVGGLQFLDPACGSGSFLVGMYRHLLAWYEAQYRRRLSRREKMRILRTHVFGVDIDPYAVEVARLSLLLQALDDTREELLPDLGANIKCGDSLVGTDWPEGLSRRPFDWQAEFPGVFGGANPGFSAVIGNPPYDKLSGVEDPKRLAAFKERYACASYKPELYAIFAERALALLAPGGIHGFIVPNSFLAGTTLRPLRQLLVEQNTLLDLAFLKDVKVFKDARLDSVVYLVEKAKPAARSTLRLRVADAAVRTKVEHKLKLQDWLLLEGRELRVAQDGDAAPVLAAIRRGATRLDEVARVHLGLVPESDEWLADRRSARAADPLLKGRDIARYGKPELRRWFSFAATPIAGGTKKQEVYRARRIVMQSIRNLKLERRLVATLAEGGIYADGTVHNLVALEGKVSLELLLGVLNSALMNYYYRATFPEHRIKGEYLKSLPIRIPESAAERAAARKIEGLVARMLELRAKAAVAASESARLELGPQVEATDHALDGAVAELYGLAEPLRKQVEEARPPADS